MEDRVLVLDMVSEAGLLAHDGVLGATASSLPRGERVREMGSGNASTARPSVLALSNEVVQTSWTPKQKEKRERGKERGEMPSLTLKPIDNWPEVEISLLIVTSGGY